MLVNESVVRSIIRKHLLHEKTENKPKGFKTSLSTNAKIEKIIRNHAGGRDIGTGNPIYQKALGKSEKQGADGQIPNTLEKLRKKGFDLSVIDLRKGNDFSLNIDALELYLKYYNKIVKDEPKTSPKDAEAYAYKNMQNQLKVDNTPSKKEPNPESGEGEKSTNPSATSTVKKVEKETKPKKKIKKKASPNRLIEKIQKLLNVATTAGTINGDYQSKKLDEDGKWGSRTRSATSKALSLFTQADLRNQSGFKVITASGLNTKKAGGAGRWSSAVLKLTKGVVAEGAGSEDFKKGTSKKPYGKLIYVLTKLNEYQRGKNQNPNPEETPEEAERLEKERQEKIKREQALKETKDLGVKMVEKITAHGKKNSQKALKMESGYKTFVFDKNAALKFPWNASSAGEYITYKKTRIPNYYMRKVNPQNNSTKTVPLIDKPGDGFGPVGSNQAWICFYVSPQTWGNIKLSGVDRQFSDIKKANTLVSDQKIPDNYEPRKQNVVWCVNKENKFLYIFDLND